MDLKRKHSGMRVKRAMGIAAERLRPGRSFFPGILAGMALLVLHFSSPCLASQVEARTAPTGRQSAAAPPAAAKRVSCFTLKKYANLSELVTEICQDARRFYSGFYGQAAVRVQPFVFFTGTGDKKFSPIGASLADQMSAMINNQQGAVVASSPAAPATQELKGVLIELDGYLRIHMSGVNAFNQRRSYTARVEMSKALYRALYADTF